MYSAGGCQHNKTIHFSRILFYEGRVCGADNGNPGEEQRIAKMYHYKNKVESE